MGKFQSLAFPVFVAPQGIRRCLHCVVFASRLCYTAECCCSTGKCNFENPVGWLLVKLRQVPCVTAGAVFSTGRAVVYKENSRMQ